jgi:hypothetical protein
MQNDTYTKEKDLVWHAHQDVFETLCHTDDLTRYFSCISHVSSGFGTTDRSIRCMDGRTPGGKHFAGSGILLANRRGKDFALETLAAIHPDGIYSHEECGAANLVATLQGLEPEAGEKLAVEWACEAAEALHIPYLGHLPVDAPFHNEMATYYDGTGRIDPVRLSDHIVPGFDITRQYHRTACDAQEELMISIGIAFGKNGFNDRFTRERPFLVIVIGHTKDPELSAPRLMEEVLPVVDASLHRDRIRILSLTPEQCWLVD